MPAEPPLREQRPSRASWIGVGAVAGLVAALDQLTKAVVRAQLELGEQRPTFGPFSIHHVRNSGILGGHLQGIAVPLGAATAVLLAALVVFLARRARPGPTEIVALGLLLGGGLGNLVDRLRLGYVTDFVDRGNDRAFNLADASITLGLVTLAIALLVRRWRARPPLDLQADSD